MRKASSGTPVEIVDVPEAQEAHEAVEPEEAQTTIILPIKVVPASSREARPLFWCLNTETQRHRKVSERRAQL